MLHENPTIVIFGATGDLATRKLFPALYGLFRQGMLQKSVIVGVALGPFTRESLIDSIKPHIHNFDGPSWELFCVRLQSLEGDLSKEAVYRALQEVVPLGPVLYYCSTAPFLFIDIARSLSLQGLIKKGLSRGGAWGRIIFEKPFASDALSAQALYEELLTFLDKEQIFCIDHYLGKPMVQMIESVLRAQMSNFLPGWDYTTVDQVQISINEHKGIGFRGGYYDKHGALDDMIQNHLLQMLGLVLMDTLLCDVSRAKGEVISGLRVEDVVFGQYEGYRDEPHVSPSSNTETFVALKLASLHGQLREVPCYLKTGKALHDYHAIISIVFNDECKTAITWVVEPKPAVFVQQTREGRVIRNLPDGLHHHIALAHAAPAPYESLFMACMQGKHELFVSNEEIVASWRFIDQVRQKPQVVHTYKQGSRGPEKALSDFEERHGMQWLDGKDIV